MQVIKANKMKKYDNWTALIYSAPGKGKTTMVKGLEGRTIVFSVDGMYHVLSGLDNVDIIPMDSKKPSDELASFYKYVLKNINDYENIVIDNLSTFQKFWLNGAGKETRSGMPEIKDYGIIDRVLLDFIASLKDLKKNVLLFAHEKKEEITKTNGGTYTQFQPDIRNLHAIMGIIPLVGRLVITTDEEKQRKRRIVILQPSQSTEAKDQLIGNLKTAEQMELLKILNNKGE